MKNHDTDRIVDALSTFIARTKVNYDGPMGIFTDYEFCDSGKDTIMKNHDADRIVDALYTFIARVWTSYSPETYLAAADNIVVEKDREEDADAVELMVAAEAYLRKRAVKAEANLQEFAANMEARRNV